MLAVVTEITVKLLPRPQLARAVLASFDDIVKAGDAVAAIIAEGIIPAGMEMMDRKTTAAVEPTARAKRPIGLKPPRNWKDPPSWRPCKARRSSR